MTFKEKLRELNDESLLTQKEFLAVVKEIRAMAKKGDALPEELIFRKDELYYRFEEVLELSSRLTMYVIKNNIDMDNEYSKDSIV